MTTRRSQPSPVSEVVFLPSESFDQIAVRMLEYANGMARTVEAGQIIAARGQAGPGVTLWLDELEQAALAAGAVYKMFRSLAPHEAEVRDFVSKLGGKV